MKNIIIAGGIIAFVGGAYFLSTNTALFTGSETVAELSEVVAVVNGEEIFRTNLDALAVQIAASQGVDAETLDAEGEQALREQAINAIISQTLLRQAVARAGVTASQEDVDAQMAAIAGQFEDTAAFEAALSAEGTTEADLRAQVLSELSLQVYIREELDVTSLTATEEEVRAAYENVAANNENVPELSVVYSQIESTVIAQKRNALLGRHIEELRTDADIDILI